MPDPGSTGRPMSASYDTSNPGVVIDRVTGLMWQRAVSAQTVDWPDATALCGCLGLAGHDDWRVPSRIELVSIVDFNRHDPALDPDAFPDTPTDWFWTSSPLWQGDPPAAWYVAFFDGNTHYADLAVTYHVRCVRGGMAGQQRYMIGGDGTVVDTATRLTWQQRLDGTRRSFAEATAACAALPLAGGGWRLPSMKELQTIVDETRTDPAIDPAAFPETPSEGFWAANPLAGMAQNAWFVTFANGIAYNAVVEHPYSVRCVR